MNQFEAEESEWAMALAKIEIYLCKMGVSGIYCSSFLAVCGDYVGPCVRGRALSCSVPIHRVIDALYICLELQMYSGLIFVLFCSEICVDLNWILSRFGIIRGPPYNYKVAKRKSIPFVAIRALFLDNNDIISIGNESYPLSKIFNHRNDFDWMPWRLKWLLCSIDFLSNGDHSHSGWPNKN